MQPLQPLHAPTPSPEDFAFSRLIAYAAYQWPQYADAPHHRLIARKLEQVERGEITRLMINMPPRHGKSMLASEFFPAWYLGRNPDHYVIAATYAQDLADDFGRKVRNQIVDTTFQAVFPGVSLKKDSTSSKRFHVEKPLDSFSTGQHGAYFAVGVGGPLTGRGAHLLLIDDPVKNREDADSETIREKIKGWYTSSAYTRLMPGGRIIIIQTRWHEDDLSGWLLEEHADEGWDILTLPAINDQDQALWPEQYPATALSRIRQMVGPRDWSALYQQRPAPEEGNFFLRDWFRTYETRPQHLKIYGASDFATKDSEGDFTVHGVFGIDPDDNVYVLDWWRKQTASDVWVETLIDLFEQWEPTWWAMEQGQINMSIGPFLKKRMRERRIYAPLWPFSSTTDKQSRAQSIRARMAMGKVYFPRTEWAVTLQSELLSFPTAKNDDQVDAMSLLGRMLNTMSAGKQPQPDEGDPFTPEKFAPTIDQMIQQRKRKRLGK